MAQTPAVLTWFENQELRDAVGPIPNHCFDDGVVNVPTDIGASGGGPAPASGRYLLLSDEVSAFITLDDPYQVLLVDTHRADEVRWMMHFDHPGQEAAVAEQVRKQLMEAVDLRIRDGAVPLSPTVTYLDDQGSPASGYLMHGVCIVATRRP